MSKDNYFQILLAPSPIGGNNFVLEDDNPAKIKQFDTFDDAKYYYLNSINHEANSDTSYCYIVEVVKWTSVYYNKIIQDGIAIEDMRKVLFKDMIVSNDHWHLQDESFILKVKDTRSYLLYTIYDDKNISQLTKDIKKATKFTYQDACQYISSHEDYYNFQIIEDIFYNEVIEDTNVNNEYYIIKDNTGKKLVAGLPYKWDYNAPENYIFKFSTYLKAKNVLDNGRKIKDEYQSSFLNSSIFKVTESKVKEEDLADISKEEYLTDINKKEDLTDINKYEYLDDINKNKIYKLKDQYNI